MHWAVWSLLANACIMWVEYANHHFPQPNYVRQLAFVTGAPIVVAQYGLYRSFAAAEHLLLAWLVFTLGNALMRLSMVHFFSDQRFAWWTVIGVALIIAGGFVVKEGIRYGSGG